MPYELAHILRALAVARLGLLLFHLRPLVACVFMRVYKRGWSTCSGKQRKSRGRREGVVDGDGAEKRRESKSRVEEKRARGDSGNGRKIEDETEHGDRMKVCETVLLCEAAA